MSNNDIVDLNYNLKTLQLKDTTDENDKIVKVIDRTFMDLVRLDSSTQYEGENILAQVVITPGETESFISVANMRNYQPSNYFGTLYVSSGADFTNKQFRCLCLDNDYNEFWQYGFTDAADGSVLVPLALPCRGVNYIETLETTYYSGTAYRFLLVDILQVVSGITYKIRINARTNNRGYTNFYTVPKGKKVRLVNIDNINTQNSVPNTIQQIIFKKQSSRILSNQILSNAPDRTYVLDIINNNWAYEGDVICHQQTNTTSTSTTLNTTYEIQKI
jgi:hypothetical protein